MVPKKPSQNLWEMKSTMVDDSKVGDNAQCLTVRKGTTLLCARCNAYIYSNSHVDPAQFVTDAQAD